MDSNDQVIPSHIYEYIIKSIGGTITESERQEFKTWKYSHSSNIDIIDTLVRSNQSDLHPYILRIPHQTQDDTDIQAQLKYINSFFDNWVGEFLHPFGDDLLDGNILDSSLLYCYLSAQSTNFHWLAHSLKSGAYNILFREFRCVLEGLFLVYTIEVSHPNASLNEKLDRLFKLEKNRLSFGIKIFKRSAYPDWQKHYQVYKQLSEFVHLSYANASTAINKVSRDGFPETIEYSYNKQKFLQVYEIWKDLGELSIEMAIKIAALHNIETFITPDALWI